MALPPKQALNKVGDYALVQKFKGYHAREDETMLDPSIMIAPSQNVMIKESGRPALIDGYTLDGAASSVIDSGILSNFDFTNFKGNVRNLRCGFLTSAANDGKLQYRYKDATGTVNWVDLQTSLTNVRMSYTEYWDNTRLVKNVLWVDGTSYISAWNGAVTTLASATGVVAGVISTVAASPTAAGTGYTVGDILTISTGSANATVQVSTVSTGAVTGIVLVEPGTGTYTVTTGNATTGGTGAGCTINITAIATLASITKQDATKTWAQEGFSQNSGSIVIGGVSATYTGTGSGTILMGVSVDFSASAVASIVHQAVIKTALSSMTSILATFLPTVIGCGRRNQVYVGSSTSNVLYISKVNSYTDYSFTTPTRVVGEGALIPLDAPPVGFIPLENRNDTNAYDMYISEGTSTWAVIRMTLSTDLTKETLEHIRAKVGPLQGALSGRFMSKMKNHIMFMGNDNVMNFFGYMSYENLPVLQDFSYPIVNDMKSYDLTDGCVFYHRNYAYVAVPKSGLIRVYNMTDQTQEQYSGYKAMENVDNQPWFWEAPVTFPLSGFYTVDGDLYGHSFTTSESYKLFDGGSLNGQDIDANATFAFDDKNDRTQSKASDECWVEGYIGQNTVLTGTVTGDLDAFATSQTFTIDGSDTTIVAFGSGGHSLGKNPLGSQPLGGAVTSTSTRPAWFHTAKTYPESPCYLEQVSFSTKGVDLAWELITYGTNARFTNESNNDITQ